jgi:hypothetical protein
LILSQAENDRLFEDSRILFRIISTLGYTGIVKVFDSKKPKLTPEKKAITLVFLSKDLRKYYKIQNSLRCWRRRFFPKFNEITGDFENCWIMNNQ